MTKIKDNTNVAGLKVRFTYTTPGGKTLTQEAPMDEILKRAMKPAGIMREMTKNGLKYYRQFEGEVKEKVAKKENWSPHHTWDQTVDLLIECAQQVKLLEVAQQHFIDEAVLDFMFTDSIKSFEVMDLDA